MSRRHRNNLVQRIQEHVNIDICVNLLLFNILFAYVQIRLRYRVNEETFEIDTILFGVQFLTVNFQLDKMLSFLRKRDDDIQFLMYLNKHFETELTEIAYFDFDLRLAKSVSISFLKEWH